VIVRPNNAYSARFPAEMPCRLTVHLRDGRVLRKEKRDYEGFVTRPMTWATAAKKFHGLAAPFARESLREQIVSGVATLEGLQVADLIKLLTRVPKHRGDRSP
jgi:2-methylcitrate dehydratase